MIVDSLENFRRYLGCHKHFAKAFAFIHDHQEPFFESKKVTIAENELVANFDCCQGKGLSGACFEAHRKFIDIQYVCEGFDFMGWTTLSDQLEPQESYNEKKDIIFYKDRPLTWIPVPQGSFAIFFPEDVHAPLAATGPIKKIIMKVAL